MRSRGAASRANTAPAPSSTRAAGAGSEPKASPGCSGLASTTTRVAPAPQPAVVTVTRPGASATPGAAGWLKKTKSASPPTRPCDRGLTADRSNGPADEPRHGRGQRQVRTRSPGRGTPRRATRHQVAGRSPDRARRRDRRETPRRAGGYRPVGDRSSRPRFSRRSGGVISSSPPITDTSWRWAPRDARCAAAAIRRRSCYPRSSLKPVQAVAMLRAGLDLDGELLALACASHSGEPGHLDGARRILAGAGLDRGRPAQHPDPADRRRRRVRLAGGRQQAGARSPRTAPASTRPCSPPASPPAGRPSATWIRSTRCSGPSGPR